MNNSNQSQPDPAKAKSFPFRAGISDASKATEPSETASKNPELMSYEQAAELQWLVLNASAKTLKQYAAKNNIK